ncbi:hypothetical protein Ddye_007877 [Dipteronia dyeriana]|uniref:Prolamin-like domain-containing protein n=1 Tax=Dipteronia dyeriana TaxID=168575 RepID=A0AAE0CS35_9ROSI|nr:hypothetical protein Ddye_007877 [Dipteronia dyeriana]
MKKYSVLLFLLVLSVSLFQNVLARSNISDESPTSSSLLAPSPSDDDDGDYADAPSPSDYDGDDAPSPSEDDGGDVAPSPLDDDGDVAPSPLDDGDVAPSPSPSPLVSKPDPEYQPPSPSPQSPPLKHSHYHHPSPRTHPRHHPHRHLPPALAIAMKLQKCWKPIDHVKDCHTQIVYGFRTLTLDHIGSSCCKAISHITQDCFEVMFIPFHERYFPFWLRDHCASMSSSSSPLL